MFPCFGLFPTHRFLCLSLHPCFNAQRKNTRSKRTLRKKGQLTGAMLISPFSTTKNR